ncbi:MAG TPA: hypothetical protein VFL12_03525 [Thermoanaerobaculia bacterium]|nr:hypothetical protein [Thermoanaerobaculia bacterium]
MVRISTRQTAFLKRGFPVFWVVILAVIAVSVYADPRAVPRDKAIVYYGVIPPIALLGWFLWRKLLADLADEVWDAGGELIVRNRGVEAHVVLSNIVNVDCEWVTNPQRITLTLREPSVLGREIVFAPLVQWVLMRRSPIADDLVRRVDEARRR